MAEIRASSLFFAMIAGVAGAALAPVLRPGQDGAARPLLKRAVKNGLLLYEKGIETFTEMAEHASDVLAEARYEIEEERKTQADGQARDREQGQAQDRERGQASRPVTQADQVVPLRPQADGEAKARG